MAKNTIRDILPPEGRESRRPIQPSYREPSVQLHEQTSSRLPRRPKINSHKKFPTVKILVALVVLLVILFFAFTVLFSGAQIIISPKIQEIVVEGDFSAVFNSSLNELPYETVTLELIESREVPATGREEVEQKASGQIVIFNDYSSANQRLIRNTRFETSEGFVYRIDKSIIVPGQQTLNGKKVPGSVEVTVYADEPGESYNKDLIDFTIPGFRGAPQFEHFYARSKSPMAGGFIGEKLVVEERVLDEVTNELRSSLRENLTKQAISETPENFIVFDDALFIGFNSLPQGESGGNVTITERAVLHGVLFKTSEFAQHLVRNTLADFGENPVDILDIGTITLIVPNRETVRPWEEEKFIFELSGVGKIIWLLDEDQLKQDLSGRNKDAIHTILSGYPSVDKAEVIIRPFWKGSFPDSVEEIEIKLVIE